MTAIKKTPSNGMPEAVCPGADGKRREIYSSFNPNWRRHQNLQCHSLAVIYAIVALIFSMTTAKVAAGLTCDSVICFQFWQAGNIRLMQCVYLCTGSLAPPCVCQDSCTFPGVFENDVLDVLAGHPNYRLVTSPDLGDISWVTNYVVQNSNNPTANDFPCYAEIRFSGFDLQPANVENHGTWTFLTDNDMYPFAGVPATFNNYGILRKSDSSGITSIYLNYNDSGGTVDVQSGIIRFAGTNSTFIGTTFTGANGGVIFDNPPVMQNCTFSNATVTLNNGGSFSGSFISTATVTLAGGLFVGNNQNFAAPINWTAGTLTNASFNYGTIKIAQTNQTILAQKSGITNYGTLLGGAVTLETNAAILNLPGGVVQNLNFLPGPSGPGVFYNRGVYTHGPGAGTNIIGIAYAGSTSPLGPFDTNDCGDGVIIFNGNSGQSDAGAYFGGTRFTGGAGSTIIANGATFWNTASLTTNLVLASGNYHAAWLIPFPFTLYGPITWQGGTFSITIQTNSFFNQYVPHYQTNLIPIVSYASIAIIPGGEPRLGPQETFNNFNLISGGTIVLETNSTLVNEATGSFSSAPGSQTFYGIMQNVSLLSGSTGSGVCNNAGRFTHGSGTGTNVVTSSYLDNGGTNDCGNGVIVFGGANTSFNLSQFTGASGRILVTNGASFQGCVSLTTNLVLAGGRYTSGNFADPSVGLNGWVSWTGGQFANNSINSGFYNYGVINAIPGGQTGIADNSTFNNYGTLYGTASITGNNSTFINYGILSPGNPGGSLQLAAYVSQSSSGTLNITFGGNTTNQFGNLIVNGPVALDGSLNVGLTNNFTPAGGTSFRILSTTSRTGTFSSVSLPANMMVVYDSTGVSLVVTGGVPVQITQPAVSTNKLNVNFSTLGGFTYSVQTNANLDTTNWGLYTNINGNGSPVSLFFPITNGPKGFIRVSVH